MVSKKTKITNNKSRKPANTEKIPFPFEADKIGKYAGKDGGKDRG